MYTEVLAFIQLRARETNLSLDPSDFLCHAEEFDTGPGNSRNWGLMYSDSKYNPK